MTKSIKSILSFGTVLSMVSLMLVACEAKPLTGEDLFKNEASIQEMLVGAEVYTLNEFKKAFLSDSGNCGLSEHYRTRSHADGSDYWLFTLDTIRQGGKPIYIRGRVATDDWDGNNYKSLVIQQIVDGKQQTLRLSVDMGSVGGLFQRGQEILIRCNGLALGRYANQPQLCVPTYNNNIYANNATQKVGWAAGRIPSSIFSKITTMVGVADVNKLVFDKCTMAELKTKYLSFYNLENKIARDTICMLDANLVEVTDVHFTGKYRDNKGGTYFCSIYHPDSARIGSGYGNPEKDENTNVFGPTTKNIGYPQSRLITDDAGADSINISTSEYAKYAYYYLPSIITFDTITCEDGKKYFGPVKFDYEAVKGNIRGVIGYYMDNSGYAPEAKNWAITPSGFADMDLYEYEAGVKGDKWFPFEFSVGNYILAE